MKFCDQDEHLIPHMIRDWGIARYRYLEVIRDDGTGHARSMWLTVVDEIGS